MTVSKFIHAAAALLAEADAMELFLKTLTGKTVAIEVDSADTILHVKELVQAKEGIPVAWQKIIAAGREVPDGNTVGQRLPGGHTLTNLATIHLVVREPQPTAALAQPEPEAEAAQRGQVQLFLKMLDGRAITIHVNTANTIRQLKELVQAKDGIPVENQRIIVAGRELPDASRVGDPVDVNGPTHLWSLATIHLVLRQPAAANAQPHDELARAIEASVRSHEVSQRRRAIVTGIEQELAAMVDLPTSVNYNPDFHKEQLQAIQTRIFELHQEGAITETQGEDLNTLVEQQHGMRRAAQEEMSLREINRLQRIGAVER